MYIIYLSYTSHSIMKKKLLTLVYIAACLKVVEGNNIIKTFGRNKKYIQKYNRLKIV